MLAIPLLSAHAQWQGTNPVYVTSEKVGIGTANPDGKLEINDSRKQIKLRGGSVAGGLWTNGANGLFLADWETGTKGLNIDLTSDTVYIGTYTDVETGYGSRLDFLGASLNTDPLWISRYNNGSNLSELRVNIGDDVDQAKDMFVAGTHSWNGYVWYPHFVVQATGRVGIGTTQLDEALTVKGTIHSEEVRVDLNVPGPDYVFEEDYQLLSLSEIEAYIKQNKHLPEIPSSKEMHENGINLKEMNLMLLKKVEVLTLHLIEMNKTLEGERALNQKHEEEITELNNLKKILKNNCQAHKSEADDIGNSCIRNQKKNPRIFCLTNT